MEKNDSPPAKAEPGLALVLRKKAEWGKAAQGLRQNHLPRASNGEKRDLIEDQRVKKKTRKERKRKKENDLADNDQYARAQSAGLT